MIKRFSAENENHLHLPSRSVRLSRQKQKKIDKLVDKYTDGTGTIQPEHLDKIERWVDDDFDDMEARRDESLRFFESLEEHGNVPIKSTGRVWHHAEERIGKIFGRIHKSNINNGTDTIIVFRDGDKSIYRLSFKSDKTAQLLHSFFKEGYIISTIDVNYGDINKY